MDGMSKVIESPVDGMSRLSKLNTVLITLEFFYSILYKSRLPLKDKL